MKIDSKTMSGHQLSRYKINRRWVKQHDLDTRVRVPKDVNERTWAEILQKEDIDLALFDLREEIVEEAMRICYEKHMEKQNTLYAGHCAAEAFLKLIDWAFYRHDPGEDPSANPPCHIPRRAESWVPDEPPVPSPKDCMARHQLPVLEEVYRDDNSLRRWPSNTSIDYPVVDALPKKYWFPGKVKLQGQEEKIQVCEDTGSQSMSSPRNMNASSELLQKITNYSTGTGTGPKPSIKGSTSSIEIKEFGDPEDSSLQGGGDSVTATHRPPPPPPPPRRPVQGKTSKVASYRRSQIGSAGAGGAVSGVEMAGRSSPRLRSRVSSNRLLAPLSLHGTGAPLSDCHMRSHRVETLYAVTSEKVLEPQHGRSLVKK